LECYHVSGDADFMLKVIVKDMRAYETFVREKLSKIKGVQQIKTSFVFGTNKQTSEIPL
jgi:Lrp/AsnC family leucine-responsive transcriptional regulator